MINLQTDRLSLVPMELHHAPFLFQLVNSRGFLANIGDRKVRTPEDAERYVRRVQDTCEKFGFDPFVVKLKSSDAAIGICNLLRRDWLEHPDVGFAFLESNWGQGFAFEAATAVLEHERAKTNLTHILGITVPENMGSVRVLEKLGLQFQHMILPPGESREVRLYSRAF